MCGCSRLATPRTYPLASPRLVPLTVSHLETEGQVLPMLLHVLHRPLLLQLLARSEELDQKRPRRGAVTTHAAPRKGAVTQPTDGT